MPLEEITRPYEILFRFNDEGNLQGAHYIDLTIIKRDGITIQSIPGNAQPVALGADATGVHLDEILGVLAASQQARLEELTNDLATERARATDLETQLGEAQGQVTVLESRVVRLQDQLAKEDV